MRVLAIERKHASQQLIEHDAGGKDVGTAVNHLSIDLLGRHVSDGPDHLTGTGERVVADARDPEIHDLAIAVAQYIRLAGLMSRCTMPR